MSEERNSLIPRHQQAYGAIDGGDDIIESPHNSLGDDSQLPSTSTAQTEDSRTTTYQMKSTLSFLNKLGFGLGHVFNDLCAGVWFSYTLLFMQGALLIPGAEAGALMMLGQVGDAIATPIVGYLADKYGTKRNWHLVGEWLLI